MKNYDENVILPQTVIICFFSEGDDDHKTNPNPNQ